MYPVLNIYRFIIKFHSLIVDQEIEIKVAVTRKQNLFLSLIRILHKTTEKEAISETSKCLGQLQNETLYDHQ